MKRYLILLLCLCIIPFNVKAETLNEYIAEAEAALKAQKEATAEKEMTEEEKEEALAEKEEITNTIVDLENEIASLEDEIERLQESIAEKEDEIKSIIHYVQISDGENAYLEYAFGASSFTDFIYRMAVAEQLSNYNDDLISQYNQDIKDMEEKQKEASEKQTELEGKQEELEQLIDELSDKIEDLDDSAESYEAEYKNLMSYVNTLKSMGCDGDDDMESCQNKLNPPTVTTGASSGFYLPLDKGRVTQNYKGSAHNAIDMTNYEGAPVYAVTTGKVISISRNQSCGKNIVYIIHTVNGKHYTTVYYHLKTVTVSENQTVYYTTQIGTQGGNPSYDSCTTGSHLDFKLFTGWYLTDFYSTSSGPHIDPRTWLTQLPAVGKTFSGRG